jgi:hypothetical protein
MSGQWEVEALGGLIAKAWFYPKSDDDKNAGQNLLPPQ